MIEITVKEHMQKFKKLLRTAKIAQAKASEAEQKLFSLLYEFEININHIPTHAENADNLEEAISCYISYGEYGEANVLREIEELLEKQACREAARNE